MGVIRYDITEEAFSNQKLSNSELSILTGVDSSTYLVVDKEQQILALRAIAHDGNDDWWTEDERLKHSFSKTRLAWLSEKFTFVPARLYDGDQRQTYLSGLTSLSAEDTVLADAIPELDAFIVYALNTEKLSKWRRVFIGCRFYHILTPVLHQLAQHNRLQLTAKMYAYFRGNLMVVIGIDKGKLKFCNAFSCKEIKDFLYFLLLAYEQCEWNPSQVSLGIIGELLEDSAIYKLFYRYVKKISFLGPTSFQSPSSLIWGKQSQHAQKHQFYDLVSLQLYH